MSADLLREAASKMRERAEAVPAGPWDHGQCEPANANERRVLGQYSVVFGKQKVLGLVPGFKGDREPFAEHVASWHPFVALAVADWLDACAQFLEDGPDYTHDGEDYALIVARAYLGSDR